MLTLAHFNALPVRAQYKAISRLSRVAANAKKFDDKGVYQTALDRFNGQIVGGVGAIYLINGRCRPVGIYRNNHALRLSVTLAGYKLSKGETFLGYGASIHFNKYDFN